MTSIERFIRTAEFKTVDRPALWLGIPDTASQQALLDYFGVRDLHELKSTIGDDFYAIELPYHNKDAHAIYAAFDWYGNGAVDTVHRTLTADGCFKDAQTIEDIEKFDWPDPAEGIDPKACRMLAAAAPKDKAVLGVLWSAHFQDACAAFGMETAMVNMLIEPELYEAVNRKILDFYLKANEIFYKATQGLVHAVLIGNDFGSQNALMLSREMIQQFVIPGCKELVAQAKSYGLKVIYHSCGAISDIIPDLIEAGVDIVHPMQVLATGMQPERLKQRFGRDIAFCGGVDTQDLLVRGTPQDVYHAVKQLRALYPTGLIISPSHEAILPDIHPENIKAMLDAARER